MPKHTPLLKISHSIKSRMESTDLGYGRPGYMHIHTYVDICAPICGNAMCNN